MQTSDARKAQAERDHDCERQGHQKFTDVREPYSVVPTAFLCGECELVLHVADATTRTDAAKWREIRPLLEALDAAGQRARAVLSPSPSPNPSETREATDANR